MIAFLSQPIVAASGAQIFTAVCSGVVACAALVALNNLAHAKKTRHGQVFAEFSQRWDSERVLESQKLFREWDSAGTIKLIDALWADPSKKPDPNDLEQWYKLEIYPNLIETIGVFYLRA